MSGRISHAVALAIEDYRKGMTAYAAARKNGIPASSLYRALSRLELPRHAYTPKYHKRKDRPADYVKLPHKPVLTLGQRMRKAAGLPIHPKGAIPADCCPVCGMKGFHAPGCKKAPLYVPPPK